MKMNWIFLSFVALVSFSVMVTLITYVSSKGVSLPIILFGIFSVGAIGYLFQAVSAGGFKDSISLFHIGLIVIMGLLSLVGNFAQFQASNQAPNPGLAIAVVSLQAGLIAILAVVFLKNSLSPLQIAGLVVTLIGIILISVGSPK